MNRSQKRPDIICRCNNVSRETIENAIRDGCRTMNEIYDCTNAGVGPCGGSCRRIIAPILKGFLETGDFPQKNPKQKPEKSQPNTTPTPIPRHDEKKEHTEDES